MIQRTCDICGREVKSEYDLKTLLEGYQLEDVKHICDRCHKDFVDLLFKHDYWILTLRWSFGKRVLMALRERLIGLR